MTEDQDVFSIVIRKLGQHRIYAPDQTIERLSAWPIYHGRVTVLPVALCMWLSVSLSSASKAIWAQIRKFFDGPKFERNVREAHCCWQCSRDGALEGG
ncbi:hypothetical protein D3C85_1457130 [compost metagenome]